MTRRFRIPQLDSPADSPFPDPARCDHPEGLVAWGGDLSTTRLLNAYRSGIFPWYEHGSPILWWSPEPRAVLIPDDWHLPKRLRRTLRQGNFQIRLDSVFDKVVIGCAGPRHEQTGTWITPAMQEAYQALHRAGHAHSIEVWSEQELIGGLYGVAIGKVFFAESKFHHRRDASKIALAVLMRCLEFWNFMLADCQIWNPHLETLGVRLLDGESFRAVVKAAIDRQDVVGNWSGRLADVNLSDW